MEKFNETGWAVSLEGVLREGSRRMLLGGGETEFEQYLEKIGCGNLGRCLSMATSNGSKLESAALEIWFRFFGKSYCTAMPENEIIRAPGITSSGAQPTARRNPSVVDTDESAPVTLADLNLTTFFTLCSDSLPRAAVLNSHYPGQPGGVIIANVTVDGVCRRRKIEPGTDK